MPFDFVGPLGYVLVTVLSSWVNRNVFPAPSTLLFHAFMVLRSQLWGQIIDIGADAKVGRRTAAVTLGVVKARVLLAALVFCEFLSGWIGVGDNYVAAFSALSLVQALVEVFFYPPKSPTLYQAAATGLVMTPAAGLLLLHVFFKPVFW